MEIGAGGTLLQLAASVPGLHVDVVVLTSTADRAEEAHRSAAAFLAGTSYSVRVHDLPDGRLPSEWRAVKDLLAQTAAGEETPDLILAPSAHDAHQDHRTVAEIVPTVFRGVLSLGYEITKWDGDLAGRTAYVPLSDEVAARKADLLLEHFPSQHQRAWYARDVFLALARLRGVECQSRYAEAFACSKLTIDLTPGATS